MTTTMRSVYREVTPVYAKELLEDNSHNRKRKDHKVIQYSRDMQTGGWRPSGATIQIGTSGRLLDGQNRLYACIKANVPFMSWIIYDVPDNSFPVIDTGAVRNGADVFKVAGEKDTYYLAAVVNALIAFERGTITTHINAGTTKALVTNQDRMEMLSRFPSIRESVEFSVAFSSRTPISVLHFVGTRVNREETIRFLNAVKSGAGLEEGNPALLYRDRLLTATSRGVRAGVDGESGYKLAIGIKALDSFIKGERRSQLAWRFGGEKSERFPLLTGDTLFASRSE